MIEWAVKCECPWPLRRAPRGVKALGVRFETQVAKALPGALHGPWFRYKLNGRVRHCQPDFILRVLGKLVVAEAKFTDDSLAWSQLRIYCAVVEKILGERPLPLVVVRRLHADSTNIVEDFESALEIPFPVVHWLGKTPLIRRRSPHISFPNVKPPS